MPAPAGQDGARRDWQPERDPRRGHRGAGQDRADRPPEPGAERAGSGAPGARDVQDVRSFVRVGNRELSASQMLERFGFRGDQQWTLVGDLSGGERRRLQLLRLLMDEPNVLLLDEPTNDLDIETLTELEDLLDGGRDR